MKKKINLISGDKLKFDKSWRTRDEAHYTHSVKGIPLNQIQLAFKSHWEVFNDVIGELSSIKGSVLEVGCGRGSLSSYFSDAGWKCTLLDYSFSVLNTANVIFKKNFAL